MTWAEQQVIEGMKKISESRPETSRPDPNFLRDWAYGNAGIEDETITIAQVEQVLENKK